VISQTEPMSSVDLAFIDSGTTGDARDQNVGLDRFARGADRGKNRQPIEKRLPSRMPST